LPELLHPDPKSPWDVKNYGRLISEAHMRLATPFYNLALPMIALAAVLGGRFSRRGFTLRILIGIGAALLVRLVGVGATSLVQHQLGLIFVHYHIPIATIAVCAVLIGGHGFASPL